MQPARLKHYFWIMEIKRATEQDIPTIAALANKIWNAYYPAIISQEQIDYMLHRGFSHESLQEQLKSDSDYFLLMDQAEPLGFLSIGMVDTNAAFLHKLYIDNSKHRTGAGTFFLQTIFNGMPELKTVRLTVNRQNYKAINFYFKNGFIIEEVKDFDIGKGYFMNDFVMRKDFLQSA